MEPLGPAVSSSQVPDSLNPPKQSLKVPLLGTSTEEKAALAHKAETENSDRGRCLTIFVSTSSLRHKILIKLKAAAVNSTPIVPTIVIGDMGDDKQPKVTAPHANQASQALAVEQVAPGAFPTKPAPTIPEWYTVGWRQAVGIDKPPLSEGEEKDNSVLHIFKIGRAHV